MPDPALQGAAAKELRSELHQAAAQLRLLWLRYPSRDPRKMRLGELLTDLDAERIECLELARFEALADLLEDAEPVDQRVLALLRDLGAFTELASLLRSADDG